MLCRFKDFRRIATRCDKRADTFLSAVFSAAAFLWWFNRALALEAFLSTMFSGNRENIGAGTRCPAVPVVRDGPDPVATEPVRSSNSRMYAIMGCFLRSIVSKYLKVRIEFISTPVAAEMRKEGQRFS